MVLSASDRQFLFERFQEVLGERAGALLMDQIPEGGRELVTRSDLTSELAPIKADLVRLDAKVDVVEARLRAEMSELRTDLHEHMSAGFQKVAVTIVAANTTLFAAMLGIVALA